MNNAKEQKQKKYTVGLYTQSSMATAGR